MVTGEPDGTLRIKSVVQLMAENLKTQVYGVASATTTSDVGMEGDASSWTVEDAIFSVYDAEPGVGAVIGSEAIRSALPNAVTWEGYKYMIFTLPTTFTRAELVSFSLYLWRPYRDLHEDNMRVGFIDEDLLQIAYMDQALWGTADEHWEHVEKTPADFVQDVGAGTTFKYLYIAFPKSSSYNSEIYLDGMELKTQSGIAPLQVDTNNSLRTASNILDSDNNEIDPAKEGGNLATILTAVGVPTSIGVGQNTDIDTSAEQLTATSTPCKVVIVQADKDNTDRIFIGDTNVVVDKGVGLNAEDVVVLWISNVNKVYAIGASADQAVHWLYLN